MSREIVLSKLRSALQPFVQRRGHDMTDEHAQRQFDRLIDSIMGVYDCLDDEGTFIFAAHPGNPKIQGQRRSVGKRAEAVERPDGTFVTEAPLALDVQTSMSSYALRASVEPSRDHWSCGFSLSEILRRLGNEGQSLSELSVGWSEDDSRRLRDEYRLARTVLSLTFGRWNSHVFDCHWLTNEMRSELRDGVFETFARLYARIADGDTAARGQGDTSTHVDTWLQVAERFIYEIPWRHRDGARYSWYFLTR